MTYRQWLAFLRINQVKLVFGTQNPRNLRNKSEDRLVRGQARGMTMSMSRKDYIKLADAIYHAYADWPEVHADVASVITNALKGTNERYDSGRFYYACMNGRKPIQKRSKVS